jgi:tRNA pseudouridine55 synthase
MARAAHAHGALVVDKPEGWTSHDVVAKARSLYGQRQVGHAGTLDPMATGVLVLLFGEATKLSGYVTAASKVYAAQIRFGTSTDTLDADGEPTATTQLAAGWLDATRLEAAIHQELCRTQQAPPAFSAIKVAGRRAHAAARAGRELVLEPRSVTVHGLWAVDWDDEIATFELHVSKGYYVRAFARDLCEGLGVPGHLSSLRRTRSGALGLEHAVGWPLTERAPLLGLAELAKRTMPSLILTELGVERARKGQALDRCHFTDQRPRPEGGIGEEAAHLGSPKGQLEQAQGRVCAWLSPALDLVALGQERGEDGFFVTRGFATRITTTTAPGGPRAEDTGKVGGHAEREGAISPND